MGGGSLKGGCGRDRTWAVPDGEAFKSGGAKTEGHFYRDSAKPQGREIDSGRTDTGRRGDFCKGYGEPARQLSAPGGFCR